MNNLRSNFFNKKEFLTLREVLEITSSALIPEQKDVDLEQKIYSVATLENATSKDISFLNSGAYAEKFMNSKAGFCLIEEKYLPKLPSTMIALVHKNPYFAYAQLINNFFSYKKDLTGGISSDVVIEKSATIGKNCKIMSGVYIGHNVKIGDNCYIGPNSVIDDNCQIGNESVIHALVSLSYCIIGNSAIIHNGAKIGQDGFGFAHNQGINHKIMQLGIVEIGNDVEIGANTCIDRGTIENTKIADGVKIDNLVQIGHNVTIDIGTVMAGCTAVAGSTRIGKFVQIGGGCNIAGHLTIGDGAKLAGATGVAQDIKPMQTVGGYPAMPIKEWHRMTLKIAKLGRGVKNADEE